MRGISAAALAMASLAASASAGPVIVQVDMDPARPGIQSFVNVPPGTATVPVAIHLYDPDGTHALVSIGYLGGLDRGIAFGSIPRPGNIGQVMSLEGLPGTPANPANVGSVFAAQDPGFAGPEVQYIEYNAAAPAPIAASPGAPLFRVNIHLSNAATGDVFNFAVMDYVAAWQQGMHGAFTTRPGEMLDTGGDVTPDGTQGRFAADPDLPVPVPPGAYEVDFIDGGNRPSQVRVGGCYANCDNSTLPPALNVNDFLCFQTEFAAGDLYANCDGSTAPPVLNINDFICFTSAFATGCP
jgi:hypothetical protein